MWIRPGDGGGVCNANLVEQLDRACIRLGQGKAPVVDQPFANLLTDTQGWVQDREWILED